ncbi:hypothetical protein GCM10007049_30600 [Echinicola pacifica]|uniref:Acyl carrier protein n=1 Tax=Echinicola pacifica TaxID=346377 RepID=A0A918Q605_9BACT|nr:hypothetical protein [Echinicola pacifica]GGZ35065.1 hypothetical protein GCM10007049_30600 [Echinicola pacifica]
MKTNNFTKLKAIIEVMGKYGIHPISKVKSADFVKDLGFDKVYLNGLIYDVEDALHLELQEEVISSITNPDALIKNMLQHQN